MPANWTFPFALVYIHWLLPGLLFSACFSFYSPSCLLKEKTPHLSWFLLHYCVGAPRARSSASHPALPAGWAVTSGWAAELDSTFSHPLVWEPSPPTPVGQGRRMPLPSGFGHKLQGAQGNRREKVFCLSHSFHQQGSSSLSPSTGLLLGNRRTLKSFWNTIGLIQGGKNLFNKEDGYNYSFKCGVTIYLVTT